MPSSARKKKRESIVAPSFRQKQNTLYYTFMSFFCCLVPTSLFYSFFFFNDTATTEIYTLSLHDALPISGRVIPLYSPLRHGGHGDFTEKTRVLREPPCSRSEEHTSELQSRVDLVCRLLLEKKKTTTTWYMIRPKKNTKSSS